ncbi:MAG: nucleoside triphosphate pyrophosphatase [Wenzhouxiangellaceae bacterium]|nr:nucleoside triphosphate pyrophosphatase [Wenzhouxiangellaceae bacterium]
MTRPAQQRLVLASASPRRRQLLGLLLDDFEIEPAAIDEQPRPEEAPRMLVRRLAETKARVVQARRPQCYVLGSDTEVALDGRCLGKPRDACDARRMLTALSDCEHEVLSAVALAHPDGRVEVELSCTRVTFAPLSPDWIAAYVASGEPMDKAGAYALQGAAAGFIRALDGSDSAVIGLPLQTTAALLARAGLLDAVAGPTTTKWESTREQ